MGVKNKLTHPSHLRVYKIKIINKWVYFIDYFNCGSKRHLEISLLNVINYLKKKKNIIVEYQYSINVSELIFHCKIAE